jgi:hypothetical protein
MIMFATVPVSVTVGTTNFLRTKYSAILQPESFCQT